MESKIFITPLSTEPTLTVVKSCFERRGNDVYFPIATVDISDGKSNITYLDATISEEEKKYIESQVKEMHA